MQFINLKKQYSVLKEEIDKNIHDVLDSGNYMMGKYVKELEKELAEYVGVKYCITCANGTDALQLALMAWNIHEGDAVFVPSFTFYSTAEVVSLLGATPIFIDSDPKTFNIDCEKLENAIISVKKEGKLKPKVIIPVDLFGLPAEHEQISNIAKKYDLLILEDGAQGFGGEINHKKACSFGHISTTSFFPAKPLGCYGDGGALFTDDEDYYNLLCSLRVHGKGSFKYDNVRIGLNSRLDELQAAVLIPKLNAFREYELTNRNRYAEMYTRLLKDDVITPFVPENMVSSWAQYTILLKSTEERERIQNKLKSFGIPTMIYYPTPLHKQSVYKDYTYNLEDLTACEVISKRCLSLPMHPYLEEKEISDIAEAIISVIREEANE